MAGRQRTLLVTGATGFIGRHFLHAALRAGFEVHAVSWHRNPASAHPGISWHRANLLDPTAVGELVKRLRPTHLTHLAWIATPGVFWKSPENLDWVATTAQLFRLFYAHGGERAVGVGTCAEYAWTEEDLEENVSSLNPDTPYGRCKLAASLALDAAAAAFDRSSAWARLFFPYGPGEPAERLIPTVIRGLLNGERVECSHGNQVRDFVFVEDVATALVAILESTATGAFNVGSGRGLSLRDVISVIAARLGGADLVKFGARQSPSGDPARVVADIARMEQKLGWRPAFGIETGVNRAIAAWRDATA